MTFNDEMRIPYVSKELCEYLRETYTMPSVLHMVLKNEKMKSSDMTVGFMMGINSIMERLEAIQIQQEENDGIH